MHTGPRGLSLSTFFQTETPVLFEIISTTANEDLQYRFVLDGTINEAENPDNPDITTIGEVNDTITENADGSFTVTGATGNTFGDAWAITGVLEHFAQIGGASGYILRLGGEEISPNDLPIDLDAPTSPPPIPTPSEDTCGGHITAAQGYADDVVADGFSCGDVIVDLVCPFDETFVYRTQNACEYDALVSYGWTQPQLPPDRPPIPTPAEETCSAHINAAQQYESSVVSSGYFCSDIALSLVCPFDETVVYESPTSCQTDALRSYGWTLEQPPDDEPPAQEGGFGIGALALVAMGAGIVAYFAPTGGE